MRPITVGRPALALIPEYERHGKRVVILGMNDATQSLHGRLSGTMGAGH